jgi:hypothetical protein
MSLILHRKVNSVSDFNWAGLICNETIWSELIFWRIFVIDESQGLDKWNFEWGWFNKEIIRIENAEIASFNVKYWAISRIISQERWVLLAKLND